MARRRRAPRENPVLADREVREELRDFDLRDLERTDEHLPTTAETARAIESYGELDPDEESASVVSLFGSASRRGAWDPPANIQVYALFGGAQLDFTEADLLEGTTEVEVFALCGGVEIRVPDDIHVETDGMAIFGGFSHFSQRSVNEEDGDPPRLRIRGVSLFAGVEVKPPKKKKWRRRGRR